MSAIVRVVCLVAAAGVASAAVPDRRYHPDLADQPATGRAAAAEEITSQYWYEEAARGIRAWEARGNGAGPTARNVVMFLGDGMSVPTMAAARTLLGQRDGRTGEEAELAFEAFPTAGLAKTYCVNQQIADSACTATAYLCGVKANYGTIGVTAAVPRRDCAASTDAGTHVPSLAEWALRDGRDAGIVTTTRVTHASPAGAFAKTANRDWESDADVRAAGHDPAVCPDIADQLVTRSPGDQFKVILGGGRREFMPTSAGGERLDGRDLVQDWIQRKENANVTHAHVWDKASLQAAMEQPPEYLLGLFESSHMEYQALAADTQPTLAELTEAAIRILSRNARGFFLFVEGGRIDHAHHDTQPYLALDETVAMSEAVARAAALLPEEDTLIVVTADHSHALAFNGYTRRGGDILGPSDELDDHGVPYMTLSYTNGPGFRPHINGTRPNVTAEADFMNFEWMTHVDLPLDSETHGGDDVAVFARGPHHALFGRLQEQSRLPHLLAYAACLGDGPRAPACSAAATPVPALLLLLPLCLSFIIAYIS